MKDSRSLRPYTMPLMRLASIATDEIPGTRTQARAAGALGSFHVGFYTPSPHPSATSLFCFVDEPRCTADDYTGSFARITMGEISLQFDRR